MAKNLILSFFLMLYSICIAQNRPEREHRILKKQFPTTELSSKFDSKEFKKVKYYKEVSTNSVVYSIKLKKERLYYQLFFTEDGKLTTAALKVKEVDIPDETFQKISGYLTNTFLKYRVLEMQQQYNVAKATDKEKTLKNTFQNLILPDNIFRFFVKGKIGNTKEEKFFFFDANGNFLRSKAALPKNHDRVLY